MGRGSGASGLCDAGGSREAGLRYITATDPQIRRRLSEGVREELMKNLHEAAEGCLTLNVELGQLEADDEAVEIAV